MNAMNWIRLNTTKNFSKTNWPLDESVYFEHDVLIRCEIKPTSVKRFREREKQWILEKI